MATEDSDPPAKAAQPVTVKANKNKATPSKKGQSATPKKGETATPKKAKSDSAASTPATKGGAEPTVVCIRLVACYSSLEKQ